MLKKMVFGAWFITLNVQGGLLSAAEAPPARVISQRVMECICGGGGAQLSDLDIEPGNHRRGNAAATVLEVFNRGHADRVLSPPLFNNAEAVTLKVEEKTFSYVKFQGPVLSVALNTLAIGETGRIFFAMKPSARVIFNMGEGVDLEVFPDASSKFHGLTGFFATYGVNNVDLELRVGQVSCCYLHHRDVAAN